MQLYIDFLDFAHKLADTARGLVLESLSSPTGFETKGDRSPVTEVDRKVESALREMVQDRFPAHGILGEEYAAAKLDAEYVWVIDPIDGTKAFITGMPIYGTLISVARDGVPFLGIIEHPFTRERWVGLDGQQTTHNGIPVRTRPCPRLEDAIISLGSPESLSKEEAASFTALRSKSNWGIYGGNCYVYGRLAMGSVDISLDSGLDPFDFCALDVVVRGAGGVMSDWEGNGLTIRSGHRVIAAGDPALHRQAIAILHQS